MPIGSSLGITLPTVYSPPSTGTTGPQWATDLNTALQTLITAVETRVTPDGMNINANVEFNGYEAQELGSAKFENKSSAFSGASNIRALYVRDGELYYNDSSGNQVQITTNGRLNSAAIGGINGEYGGSYTASVYYTQSTVTYAFLSSAALRAIIDAGQVLIRATGTSGYAVKLTNPGTLVADVTRTFAAALPASTSLLTCTSAGQEAFTRDPSVDTLTLSGAAVQHGNQTRIANVLNGKPPTVTNATYTGGYATMTGTGTFIIPLCPMRVGDRLKSVTVRVNIVTTSCNITVYRHSETSGTGTSLGTTASSGLGSQDISVTGLTDVAGAHFYTCEVTNLDVGDAVISCKFVVDRP